MPVINRQYYRRFSAAALLAGFILGALLVIADATAVSNKSEQRIHIAFGFHVNLYHSFRNDTNDEAGFGKDIRIIRHLIKVLDRYNLRGVPVKAVWDFDNMFSLQEILPQHAPDIIENIRRRVDDYGDEVILMSYNNGLMSAMTQKESLDAVRWAVSNPWNSGVRDIFGKYSPIVRPQEMMTTPGNFTNYKKAGVEAVCLYYSAAPFDAFRVFSRPLKRAEAHNPLIFENPVSGETIELIPTYNIADLVEHVSLKNWVKDLHRLQQNGEIDEDLLIFINFDADSDFWSGVDLHWLMEWLPNTEGLSGLIEEVKDLPYVRFTTLDNYRKSHPPKRRVFFGQDTADGSFNGYNSWAEKSDSHWYWTRIQRNRRAHQLVERAAGFFESPPQSEESEKWNKILDASYIKRLKILSTTHFGMATPFLAPERQKTVMGLLSDLDEYSEKIEKMLADYLSGAAPSDGSSLGREFSFQHILSFMLVQSKSSRGNPDANFLKLKLPRDKFRQMALYLDGDEIGFTPAANLGSYKDENGEHWTRLYIHSSKGLKDGIYHLYGATPKDAADPVLIANAEKISNGDLEMRFDEKGNIKGIFFDGERQADAGSLSPYIRYGGKLFDFKPESVNVQMSEDKMSVSSRISGFLPVPDADPQSTEGFADYTFTLIKGRPYLLLNGIIRYPGSRLKNIFKKETPALARKADMNWKEVAPAEIRFTPKSTKDDPIRILKHNFLGVRSQYKLDYFRHSPENLNLANVNNHITDSFFGLISGGRGMAIAADSTVLTNFAFAPLKMKYDRKTGYFSIRANPFGSYHGKQYRPPTWGNKQGFEAALLSGEQYASSAPTYNGVCFRFAIMIAFFKKNFIPPQIEDELIAFANPPAVFPLKPNGGRSIFPPLKFTANKSSDAFFTAGQIQDDGAVNFSEKSTDREPHQTIPIDLSLRLLWENVIANF